MRQGKVLECALPRPKGRAELSCLSVVSYIRLSRGGVGTYCHTDSVHVDVGPERDWNWRCRRRG